MARFEIAPEFAQAVGVVFCRPFPLTPVIVAPETLVHWTFSVVWAETTFPIRQINPISDRTLNLALKRQSPYRQSSARGSSCDQRTGPKPLVVTRRDDHHNGFAFVGGS